MYNAIRNLVNYLAAEKRIQVCLMNFNIIEFEMIFIYRHFFYLMNLKEIIDCYQHLIQRYSTSIMKTNDENINKETSKVICNLKQAQWEKVNISYISFNYNDLIVFRMEYFH